MEKLPNELLTKIAELCPERTLSALCRCSLKWKMVATELLYSKPDLRGRFESQEHGYKWTLPFAFLIFTSPFHAGYVRSFTIGYWWGEERCLERCGPKRPWPVSENDAESVRRLDKVIADACRKHTVSEEDAEELYELVRSGENGGAILALVVAHLVNLRKFDFEGADKVDGPMVRAFELVTRQSWINSNTASSTNSSGNQLDAGQQQKENIPPTPFPKPPSVRVTGKCERNRNESFYAALFFNLPNLRHLYICTWPPSTKGASRHHLRDALALFGHLRNSPIFILLIFLRVLRVDRRRWSLPWLVLGWQLSSSSER